MHAVVLTYTQRTETSHTRWVPTSCTNITQLVSHTYETCFGKSLFLMETTIFDLKPDALQTLICAFLCLAPQMTSHTKLIHSLGGLDIFLRHKLAHSLRLALPNTKFSFRIFTAFCIIQPEVWLLLMVQPPVFSRILFYAGGANH